MNPIKDIVVLGGGTAGLLAALAVKRHLPEVNLTLVRSTKMGVIGVGEGTIPSVVAFLHQFLGIHPNAIFTEANATPKLGIHYLWGPRPCFNYTFTGQLLQPHRWLSRPRGYYCDEEFEFADANAALMAHGKVCARHPDGSARGNRNIAYHLENKSFVGYLERLADEWGVTKVDDIVEGVRQDESGIRSLHLAGGTEVSGDFFFDCSGFRRELIGRSLEEPFQDYGNFLFCDRAVVGGWTRGEDEPVLPYTTAETMDSGWCWKIEHDDLINRGYVFSSNHLSDDEAEAEFRRKNPKVENARAIAFGPGLHRRTWVKNVVAVGNSAGFVEPLEATAIGMICDSVLRTVKGLQASGRHIVPLQRDIFNRITSTNWEIIRNFLALHYKFNTRNHTPFWEMCWNDSDLGAAQELVDYFKEVGPDFSMLGTELKRDFFTAEGYLVMLVGQKVPYKNHPSFSTEEREKWNTFKNGLKTMASNGLDVGEFLKLARAGEDVISDKNALSPKRPQQIGVNAESGELNWH